MGVHVLSGAWRRVSPRRSSSFVVTPSPPTPTPRQLRFLSCQNPESPPGATADEAPTAATHSFRTLQDPVTNAVDRVRGSFVTLCGLIGMPVVRLRAAVPDLLLEGGLEQARPASALSGAVHGRMPSALLFPSPLCCVLAGLVFLLKWNAPPARAESQAVGRANGLSATAIRDATVSWRQALSIMYGKAAGGGSSGPRPYDWPVDGGGILGGPPPAARAPSAGGKFSRTASSVPRAGAPAVQAVRTMSRRDSSPPAAAAAEAGAVAAPPTAAGVVGAASPGAAGVDVGGGHGHHSLRRGSAEMARAGANSGRGPVGRSRSTLEPRAPPKTQSVRDDLLLGFRAHARHRQDEQQHKRGSLPDSWEDPTGATLTPSAGGAGGGAGSRLRAASARNLSPERIGSLPRGQSSDKRSHASPFDVNPLHAARGAASAEPAVQAGGEFVQQQQQAASADRGRPFPLSALLEQPGGEGGSMEGRVDDAGMEKESATGMVASAGTTAHTVRSSKNLRERGSDISPRRQHVTAPQQALLDARSSLLRTTTGSKSDWIARMSPSDKFSQKQGDQMLVGAQRPLRESSVHSTLLVPAPAATHYISERPS